MLFRCYAVIGIVLFICFVLVVKAFIWIAKKFFGFLRARCAVILLKRGPAVSVGATKSVVLEERRVDEKPTSGWSDVNNERRCSRGRNSNRQIKEQNNQVLQRSKYGTNTNVIQSQSLSKKERVKRNRPFDVCPKTEVRWNNHSGTIYRQESKNKRGQISLVPPFQHRKEAALKKNKGERGAPFRSWNKKLSKCKVDKCVRGCAIPVEELATRNNIDNFRGRDDGAFNLDETTSFTGAENTCVKRKEVDRDLHIGHPAPSDVSTRDIFNKPVKVAQRTSNFTIKYPVRLWSVDSDTNVNTDNLAPGDHQNSSQEAIKQIENIAVSSRKEDVDSETPGEKFKAKVKEFSRIVDAIAKVMLRVVMDVVWPLWQGVKEEWEIFNEIHGDNSDDSNNSDNEIKASKKGQHIEYYNSCADQCFQCAEKQVAADESDSVETSKDFCDSVTKQKLSAKLKNLWNKARALYSSALAAVNSRAAAVAFNIRLVFSKVPSRSSFNASRQEEGETNVDILDLAAAAKTEASQPRSEQPLPVETQSALSLPKESPGQNSPSQKLCSKRDKKMRFRESPIVYYTNDPVSQKKQTKKRHVSSLPSREVPPASKWKTEQRQASPVAQKSQRESESKEAEKFTKHSSLSPHTSSLLYTSAPSQVKELQCVGVSELVMSPSVDETQIASTPQKSDNKKSTKLWGGKDSNRSRGKRRYKEEETAVLHQNEQKAELNVQEAVLTKLPEKRHPNQSISRRIDRVSEETPKVRMGRKNEVFINHDVTLTHELASVDHIPRLPQSTDRGKPKLVDTMEIENYTEVPFATPPESMVVDDVSNGSFDEMRAAHNGQKSSASPNTGEQVQAMDATESDHKALLQNTQQTQQSSWNFFAVRWPPFLRTLFSSQPTMEEMEVVQEQESLLYRGEEEMVLDENPELLKISCASTEEMDVDPQNLAMMGHFAQPEAMDTNCVQAPPVPREQLMTPLKSSKGFGASRPVTSPFTELMDTKRPLAPTTGMLQDAEMQVQVACDEKIKMQECRAHGIQPVVEPPTQPRVKHMMPKLLPAKVMDKQHMQPVRNPTAKVQPVSNATMQPSQQEAMSSNVKPEMPKAIVQSEQVTQSNVSPVDQRETDPKEQLIMEKLQLVPASTDPYLADVSDSDEDDDSDDDSDDEVELDLQTIEKFSQLEASPEHAQQIMNLLAQKEHREATQFREVVHSDSDNSDEEEELDPDTKCKLYKLEACVQMYKDYNQKLAELVAAEQSTTEQCNM